MKAASQQRRTVSFKEGLLEIKKSMGGGSGQAPEEQAQKTQGKPAQKGGKDAKGHSGSQAPKGPRAPREGAGAGESRGRARPGGRPQGNRGDKAQQPGQSGEAARGEQRARPPRDARGQKPGEQGQRQGQGQHRQRPPRQQPAMENLSEAEKARIERNRQLNTVWNVLAKHYPAFRDRLPLKIGVAEDLVERHPEYERTLIVAVLKRHVNHPRYHERVAAGGARYELDGNASEGPGIDPSHVGRANAALARQKAKSEAQAKPREAAKAAPAEAAAPQAEAKAEAQSANAEAAHVEAANAEAANAQSANAEAQAPQAAAPAESAEATPAVAPSGEDGEAPATGA